jgi:hypothetical protein
MQLIEAPKHPFERLPMAVDTIASRKPPAELNRFMVQSGGERSCLRANG